MRIPCGSVRKQKVSRLYEYACVTVSLSCRQILHHNGRKQKVAHPYAYAHVVSFVLLDETLIKNFENLMHLRNLHRK